ncbi:MAG: FtsX-like permease family protein [Ruminococcaceae bacterium]|nr:FtsX-like permease family protein [Oscillospiraceae bacterium]
MKLRNIPHLIGQGFVSFWRNGAMTTAAILVLICCMLVLGSFYVVIDNLDKFIEDQSESIKTINAYVDSSESPEEVNEKELALAGLATAANSNIDYYVRITKEEALEEMKNREGLEDILTEFDESNNPLPERFRIHFKDIDTVQSLMRDLEEIFGADKIKSEVGVYEKVNSISSTITLVGLWLMIILLVIAILIIMNTVKLTVFARRKDIAIMRYIGATSAFVVSPFIVEGILVGIIAAIISTGIQYYLYDEVFANIVSSYNDINLVPVMDYLYVVPVAFLAIGIFAGVIASATSVKKHLDV